MNKPRTLVAIALLAFAGFAMAQATEPSAGQGARDGSRPADGAIKGGSILPGESAGMPEGAKAPSDRAISRCNDLSGTLREQCLLQEQGASTGGTRVPDAEVAKPPSPREAPPPQNPR